MSNLTKAPQMITSLEQLSQKDTFFHRIHPLSKIIITLGYLITVISYPTDQISGLLIFSFYPLIAIELSEIPVALFWKRVCVALPFSLFAGISNLLFNRTVLFQINGIPVTSGFLSCCSILLKTLLCVSCVLILIASTSFPQIAFQLNRLHVPSALLFIFLLIFRYLTVLLEEARHMYHAYRLRSPNSKGIKLSDMGSFLGQLLLKSFDRAERIYQAMKCRGFNGSYPQSKSASIRSFDWLFCFILCGLFVLFRIYNIPTLLGEFFV